MLEVKDIMKLQDLTTILIDKGLPETPFLERMEYMNQVYEIFSGSPGTDEPASRSVRGMRPAPKSINRRLS